MWSNIPVLKNMASFIIGGLVNIVCPLITRGSHLIIWSSKDMQNQRHNLTTNILAHLVAICSLCSSMAVGGVCVFTTNQKYAKYLVIWLLHTCCVFVGLQYSCIMHQMEDQGFTSCVYNMFWTKNLIKQLLQTSWKMYKSW